MVFERFLDTFRTARRVGTPIIAIETPDPAATIAVLMDKAVRADTPVVEWDAVRGIRGNGPAGREAIKQTFPKDQMDPTSILTPVECMREAERLPGSPEPTKGGTVLFVHGAHRMLNDPATAQAVWNLRDPYKASLRTLVLLGPAFKLPAELQNDVLVLDEPLPADEDLKRIVLELCSGCEPAIALPDGDDMHAVDALRGLAAFPAEQATAMCLNSGLDIAGLWERKRRMISDTPGLAVWAGTEKLDDIGGNAAVKDFIRLMLAGIDPPRAVLFIDEIEKGMAGAMGIGDSSGVSQGQHQLILTEMQDTEAAGMIFLGPPGAGKSAVAKAIGNEAGIPCIALDLGGTKASLVGESEQRLRNAFKVVRAVGGGRTLFVATCNKIEGLSTELRRRFTMGTYFFDLPDASERAAIWNIYKTKYELNYPNPEDHQWTGAEIKQCCLLAYRLRITLKQAAKFIVPVATSAADAIGNLRKQADGRFLSASREGFYEMIDDAEVKNSMRRMMSKED